MKKATKTVTRIKQPPAKVIEHAPVPAVVPTPRRSALAIENELTVNDLVHQVKKIQDTMRAVMKEGVHYGVIPGTQRKDRDGNDISKRVLYKPGAEKLLLLFRLGPSYEIEEIREGDHLTITSNCTLRHTPTDVIQGSGMGSCSSKETKYAYRQVARKCPACGGESIIRGREEYGGGWLCYKAKGGCGAKYPVDDREIAKQEIGRVDNPDKADQYNTILKMSNKRALVAAVLNVTAASDIFVQDVEDLNTHIQDENQIPDSEIGSRKMPARREGAVPTSSVPPPETSPAAGGRNPILMGEAEVIPPGAKRVSEPPRAAKTSRTKAPPAATKPPRGVQTNMPIREELKEKGLIKPLCSATDAGLMHSLAAKHLGPNHDAVLDAELVRRFGSPSTKNVPASEALSVIQWIRAEGKKRVAA